VKILNSDSVVKEARRKITGFWLVILLSSALFLLIISILVLSSVPPTSKDELVHHLAVPKLYIEHGGIYEIPFLEFSYYPMNLELLYAIPLYFGNDIIPKFFHFFFALFTAYLIFSFLKSRTEKVYALFGALFFLSIPVIVKLSITAYVDLGEIYFSFAALIYIIEWLNHGFRKKFLIYSGIMCGLALGTKYNGLVTLLILSFFVIYLYSRYHGPHLKKSHDFVKPIFWGATFIFISLFIFSPWMIRNYNWKRNPIYPLYNQFFNPPKVVQTSSPSQTKATVMNKGFFTYRSIVYQETGMQIAMLPVRVFFQGRDGDPQYFDGKLNPFLLLLSCFAFYKLRDEPASLQREKKMLLIFSTLFFCFAFFTAVLRIRYLSPIIPPLVLLSVFGFINIFKIFRKVPFENIRKACIVLACLIPCFLLAINIDYIRNQFKSLDPASFITGKVSRDEYINKYITEYPVIKYINNNVDTQAKVLFILVGNRGYYCDRNYTHDMGILKKAINKAKNPEDILKTLKGQGITHLLVNYMLFEKWMNNNFSGDKRAITQQFFREHLSLLISEKEFGVSILK
jgi:hypothetical protein